MVFAVSLNEDNKVIAVSSFENESEVPEGLIIYQGDVEPEKLLRKTREELGI